MGGQRACHDITILSSEFESRLQTDTLRTNKLITNGMTPFTVGEWEAGDYS